MDGCTSSSSNSNKQHPLIPKGVDENGKIYQGHKHSRTTTATRQFMSPTISATSKYNPSRKKILGERNESFDNLQKNSNLDSKSLQKSPISDPNRSFSELNAVSDDLSSKPYDPLTNYLSPRPRFLRYKPNRRRQILLRREAEEKEGKNDAVPANSESDCGSSCGSLTHSQSDEIDDSSSDDEFEIEFEEVKDERWWSFRGAFKVLMLLFVLVISTLYISSMNSPTPSPVVLAVSGVRYGYHMMANHVCEYMNRSFLFNRVIEQEKIVDVRMEESSHELKEENDRVVEIVKDGEGEEEEEVEKSIEDDEKMVDLEEEGEGEADDTFEDEEILEQQEEEWNVIIDLVDGANNIPDFRDFEGSEIADVSVFKQAVEEPSSVADELEKEKSIMEGIFERERVPIGNVTDDIHKIGDEGGNSMIKSIEMKQIESVADELEKEESIMEGIFERERVPIGNVTDDIHKIGDEGGNSMIKSIEMKQIESVSKAVIGFFIVLSSFFASRVLIRRRVQSSKSRIAREKTPPTSFVADEPRFESVPAHEEQERSVESAAAAAHFGIPKSLMNSMEEEASKDTKERRSSMSLSSESRAAPVIEQLGELELSGMSTSFRSCDMKNRGVTETEVNSISVFMEKAKIGTKPVHDVSSTFNSPSYLDEKKQPMKKKEREGGDTAGKNELTTPVRRSSRIRNRALSP